MDPRILPPIPTPPAQRWREIRLVFLPRLMFIAGVLVVAWMWNRSVMTSSMVAEAEVLGAELRAPQAGVLASLKVALYQRVRAGDTIGHVTAANPRLLEANLGVIRAEVGMIGATMAGATDRQRVALELERLQLDWMRHRVERAELQGRLQQAESDVARAEPLHRSGLMTTESFEQLKQVRQTLTEQVKEMNQLVARLEPILRAHASTDAQAAALSNESAISAAIKVQEANLKLAEAELAPVALVAPIDGVVSFLFRRAGETVAEGEPILRITSPKPERLSGYLLQPLPFTPTAGMAVEIRRRGFVRQSAPSTITHVSTSLEIVTPTMLAALRLPTTYLPESALRVEIALPRDLELLPGEHVDVVVR
jgi:HlyD family secretion protein